MVVAERLKGLASTERFTLRSTRRVVSFLAGVVFLTIAVGAGSNPSAGARVALGKTEIVSYRLAITTSVAWNNVGNCRCDYSKGHIHSVHTYVVSFTLHSGTVAPGVSPVEPTSRSFAGSTSIDGDFAVKEPAVPINCSSSFGLPKYGSAVYFVAFAQIIYFYDRLTPDPTGDLLTKETRACGQNPTDTPPGFSVMVGSVALAVGPAELAALQITPKGAAGYKFLVAQFLSGKPFTIDTGLKADDSGHTSTGQIKVTLTPTASSSSANGGSGGGTGGSDSGGSGSGGGSSHCVVPMLIGKTLTVAATRLVQAHCKLGTVIEPKPKTGITLVVSSSSPTAGTSLPSSTKVNLKLRAA
jgi:uncharacterized membrane protein YgcG